MGFGVGYLVGNLVGFLVGNLVGFVVGETVGAKVSQGLHSFPFRKPTKHLFDSNIKHLCLEGLGSSQLTYLYPNSVHVFVGASDDKFYKCFRRIIQTDLRTELRE